MTKKPESWDEFNEWRQMVIDVVNEHGKHNDPSVSTQKQIDNIRTFQYWIIGLLVTLIIGSYGYTFVSSYDRYSAKDHEAYAKTIDEVIKGIDRRLQVSEDNNKELVTRVHAIDKNVVMILSKLNSYDIEVTD